MATIREIRKAKGLSVKALAAAAGVTPMSIYRYEREGRIPKFGVMCKIAKTLGVKVTELFAEDAGKPA